MYANWAIAANSFFRSGLGGLSSPCLPCPCYQYSAGKSRPELTAWKVVQNSGRALGHGFLGVSHRCALPRAHCVIHLETGDPIME